MTIYVNMTFKLAACFSSFIAWFTLRPWTWWWYFPPKRRSLSQIYGATTQKIPLFILSYLSLVLIFQCFVTCLISKQSIVSTDSVISGLYVAYVNIDLCNYKIVSAYGHLHTLSLAASGDSKVRKTKQKQISSVPLHFCTHTQCCILKCFLYRDIYRC